MARERRGGRGSRAGKGRDATGPAVKRDPYIIRNIPPYEILDDAGLSLIENNAETILEEKDYGRKRKRMRLRSFTRS